MSGIPSTKPYLVRAIHEWCVDNGFTPHIVVQVDNRTKVPVQHVRNGQIVLNIAPHATGQLMISNDSLACQARFGGVPHALYVPMDQILAIYARENGQGMTFEAEVSPGPSDAPVEGGASEVSSPEVPPGASGKGSHLRRIK